jgi:hypothetical protein
MVSTWSSSTKRIGLLVTFKVFFLCLGIKGILCIPQQQESEIGIFLPEILPCGQRVTDFAGISGICRFNSVLAWPDAVNLTLDMKCRATDKPQ